MATTNRFKTFTGILTLAVAVGAATPTLRAEPAATPERRAKEARPQPNGEGRPAAALERIKEHLAELNLTSEQREKLQPILQNARSEIRTLMKEAEGMQPRERIMKLADYLAATREKVTAVLDDEQKVKFEAMMKEVRGRLQERLGDASGAVGGVGGGGGKLKDAVAQLDLTPEQKEKATAIFEDAKTRIAQVRKEAADDAKEQARTIMLEAREKLMKLLTPEQRSKFHDLMHAEPSDGKAKAEQKEAAEKPNL